MAQILVVDDDELVASLATDALINAGHACGWVTDGQKALDLLRWRRPDLLLLDQDMPKMTGSTLLRHLRTSDTLYDLPVIMLTAITGKQDEEQAIYAGAQDYIRKPFDPDGLVSRVEALLETRAERPRHEDLMTVLEKSAGIWSDPEEENASYKRFV